MNFDYLYKNSTHFLELMFFLEFIFFSIYVLSNANKYNFPKSL